MSTSWTLKRRQSKNIANIVDDWICIHRNWIRKRTSDSPESLLYSLSSFSVWLAYDKIMCFIDLWPALCDVIGRHEKNNQTLSNDWPTYCHTGICHFTLSPNTGVCTSQSYQLSVHFLPHLSMMNIIYLTFKKCNDQKATKRRKTRACRTETHARSKLINGIPDVFHSLMH